MKKNMTEDIINEIGQEFQLLSRVILAKVKDLFFETEIPYNEDEFVEIEEKEDKLKMSFLIPHVTKFNTVLEHVDPYEYVRELINSTLNVLNTELTTVKNSYCEGINLKYTGFSISSFGLILNVQKDRLAAAKLRKVSSELLASFSLKELRDQIICSEDMSLRLPGDLVFGALKKRKNMAKAFSIPNKEFDLREIDYQIDSVKSLLKSDFREVSLIAS